MGVRTAPEPKDWALDGTMSGTGRARQIWTWNRGKPNTPGVGPEPAWTPSPTSTPTSKPPSSASRPTGPRMPRSLVVSFGTTSVFVDRVVDELRAEGMSDRVDFAADHPVAVPRRSGWRRRPGKRHVVVYELNAGQMVDDVRMYAHRPFGHPADRRGLPG